MTGPDRPPAAAPPIPRPVTPTAAVLLAPNPGPMTLEGTNSWVLRAPGSPSCVVVDPGPLDGVQLPLQAATDVVGQVRQGVHGQS